MVLLEEPNAVLVFLEADFCIGTGFLERRPKGDECRVRFCGDRRLLERLDGLVGVKRRRLSRGGVGLPADCDKQKSQEEADERGPGGWTETAHGRSLLSF